MVGNRRSGARALPLWMLAFVACGLLSGNLSFAQTFTGTITGVVRDATGAILPSAAITARHTESGLTRAALSDTDGSYNLPSLPVGAYEITVVKEGFRREVRRGIDLAVGQQAAVDLTLQVGNLEQQVTVVGEAPLVNTTLSSTSGLVNEQQVKDLPLNGRSFDQLITLNVGTSNNSSNTLNNASWNGFSVAGKRPETNRFLINGIDWIGGNATGQYITPYGASGQLLGVEAVREFNLVSNTYGAEYGKRAGGTVNIVTASGTNQLHGDVFEYLRNSAFDARNFFDASIGTPPFKRHQFGGILGGPIKKDKMFLFGNYEEFRQELARSSVAVVPGANARKGLMPNGSPVLNLKTAMLPYANAFWPAPSTPDAADGTAVAFSNPAEHRREHFGLTRFDYTVSSKDSFSANYTNDNGNRSIPFVDPNFSTNSEIASQSLSLQETHVASPSLVNVFTAGYGRVFATLVQAPAVPIPSNLVFMPGGNPGSIIIGGGVITAQPSTVAAAPGNNPSVGVRNYFTYADDVHLIKGKHSFSAGAWVQRIQQDQNGAAQGSAGNVAYPTVLAFLQDKPSQAIAVRNPVRLGYRSLEAAWYLQDEIKLRRNLTFRIGLRDEMTNGWNEVANRCANYFYDPTYGIGINPHIGGSCLARNNATALWQPRVGLAWDPTGTGSWSVRAGFSIVNDLLDNLGNRTYSAPPFNAREQLTIPADGFLSLVPLDVNAALPPTCSPGIPQRPCSIYQPAGVDPNMFTPTIQEWSFTVQRQLARNLVLEVGYAGSQSYHTNLTMDTNSPAPQVCQNPQGCLSGGVLAASSARMVPQGTTYFPSTPPIVVNGVTLTQRPNPYVSNNTQWVDQGTASYHALNVSLQKRVSHGLAFKANYTWAKVIDLNSAILAPSGENEPADVFSPYNLKLNRGPASFSLKQTFSTNFSYQLPFGNGQHFGGSASGWKNHLIGGWQWNGIIAAQGGFPQTPVIGFNNSGTGDTNITDVPNWNPNFHGPVILGNVDHWFDPSAFVMPTPGTFGNVSRGSMRGPGLVNVDTSFFKRFRISERFNLQFRAEAFNLLNHSNFFYPNQVVFAGNSASYSYSDTAGQITAAATSRQLQLALKLMF
ncbi:MAG: TonB-dependent receptor [Terriglobia bacterium]|nr:MAG: TonB-dependent receptor [Terriglobia bacterium]